jgi:predicted ester cyclase
MTAALSTVMRGAYAWTTGAFLRVAWEVKEVLVDGDTIVVRSEASGTPAADVMGVPRGGGCFSVVAIAIHKVEGGKLVRADHDEDWATAIRQLSARS